MGCEQRHGPTAHNYTHRTHWKHLRAHESLYTLSNKTSQVHWQHSRKWWLQLLNTSHCLNIFKHLHLVPFNFTLYATSWVDLLPFPTVSIWITTSLCHNLICSSLLYGSYNVIDGSRAWLCSNPTALASHVFIVRAMPCPHQETHL